MVFLGKPCCLMTTCHGVLNISLIIVMLTLLTLVTWLGWHLLDFFPGIMLLFSFPYYVVRMSYHFKINFRTCVFLSFSGSAKHTLSKIFFFQTHFTFENYQAIFSSMLEMSSSESLHSFALFHTLYMVVKVNTCNRTML